MAIVSRTGLHDLLLRCRRRPSDGAWSELVRRQAPVLHATAFRILGDRALADDAVQDAFLRLIGALEHYRGTTDGQARAFLFGVVANTSRLLRRRRITRSRHERAASRSAETAIPADREGERPSTEEMLAALEEVPAAYRDVIRLRFFDDMSHARLAASLDCSVVNARKRLQRGLKHLRRVLSRQGVACTTAALLAWGRDWIGAPAPSLSTAEVDSLARILPELARGAPKPSARIPPSAARGGGHACRSARATSLLTTGGMLVAAALVLVMLTAGAADDPPPADTPPRHLIAPAADILVSRRSRGNLNDLPGNRVRPGDRYYLRFDVAGLAGRPFARARLLFRKVVNRHQGLTPSFRLYHVADDTWQEERVTWADRPTVEVPPDGPPPLQHDGRIPFYDVTDLVRRACEGDGVLSLALVHEGDPDEDILTCFPRESTSGLSSPLGHLPPLGQWLEVTY